MFCDILESWNLPAFFRHVYIRNITLFVDLQSVFVRVRGTGRKDWSSEPQLQGWIGTSGQELPKGVKLGGFKDVSHCNSLAAGRRR
jgi:hypothetical protein